MVGFLVEGHIYKAQHDVWDNQHLTPYILRSSFSRGKTLLSSNKRLYGCKRQPIIITLNKLFLSDSERK